jgi:hypothetical protein
MDGGDAWPLPHVNVILETERHPAPAHKILIVRVDVRRSDRHLHDHEDGKLLRRFAA